MTARIRPVACALLLGLFTLVLLGAFARPDGGFGTRDRVPFVLEPSGFSSPGGPVALTEHGVRAERADAAGVTVLLQSFAPRDTAGYRYLSYRLTDIPALSRPILVWGDGTSLRLAVLPEAPFARGTIDLARLPEWKGELSQLGIAFMPVDYLAPRLPRDTAIELRGLRLDPPGWSGALQALWTEWSAYRAWNGRSNQTLGFEFGQREASLQAFVAFWLVAAVALSWLCFGAAVTRRAATALIVLAVSGLALLQVRQLALNASVATAAAAIATPAQPLAAAPDLAAAADVLNARLREGGERPRMLVYGTGRFLAEYPTWLLREQDVATLTSPHALPEQARLEGWLLVLAGQGDWQFDPATRQLTLAGQVRRADLWFDAGLLKAYRFAASAGVP